MRTTIQNKLNDIKTVECGNFQPDDLIEAGITYFGYQLNDNYQTSDFDKNDTRRVTILGFITRKIDTSENTLSIIDEAAESIKSKLKELNFKINIDDVTLSDNIRKIKVTGYVYFNEINNNLVV